MIRFRRATLSLLLCLPAVGSLDGLCGDGDADPADGTASDVWYFSEFDGTGNRRWVVETEIDPRRLTQHGEHHGTHAMVVYEVTRYPDAGEPTPEQRLAAESLRERSLAAARKHGWLDFNRAVEDGFHVRGHDPAHFQNDEFALDDRVLDPDRPEFLIYHDTTNGRKLAGYMYQVRTPEERGPQVGGPLTIWHYHIFAEPHCMLKRMIFVSVTDPDGTCPVGEPASKSPEMMHVWFLERPGGPFATKMNLTPDLRKQLADREY